jgi:hypothetical protein
MKTYNNDTKQQAISNKMKDSEQTRHFADEIDKVVDRFRKEYDITLASTVGVLHLKAFLLMQEHCEDDK